MKCRSRNLAHNLSSCDITKDLFNNTLFNKKSLTLTLSLTIACKFGGCSKVIHSICAMCKTKLIT